MTTARANLTTASDLGSVVRRGLSWSVFGAIILRVGQLAATIVVARIVVPEQFGVYAAALVVYTIVTNVSDLGLTSAILVEPDRTREIAPTVITSVLTSSGLLGLATAVLAAPLAGLLSAPAAVPAIQLMAVSTFIGGVGAVPGAILVRDFRQRGKFAVDVSSFVVGTAVLVTLATLGFGAMALAWSRVANQCASLVCLLVLTKEWYWPGFNRSAYSHVIRLGLPVAGASLVGFAVGNVDNAAVSRARGAHELGMYSQAFNISGWPVALFTAMVDSVTVPMLSRVRDRPVEFLRYLRAAVGVLALVASLSAALISALGSPIVDLLLGQKWAAAASALQILAWFGAVRVVIALFSDALVALRQTRMLLVLNLLWALILLPSMIWASYNYGMMGAAADHVVVAALVMLPLFGLAVCRSAELEIRSIASVLWIPLIGGGAAWCGATWAIQANDITVVRLALGMTVGVSAFCAVTGYWVARRLLPELTAICPQPTTPEVSALEDG